MCIRDRHIAFRPGLLPYAFSCRLYGCLRWSACVQCLLRPHTSSFPPHVCPPAGIPIVHGHRRKTFFRSLHDDPLRCDEYRSWCPFHSCFQMGPLRRRPCHSALRIRRRSFPSDLLPKKKYIFSSAGETGMGWPCALEDLYKRLFGTCLLYTSRCV